MTKVPLDGNGGVMVHSKINGHGFGDENWHDFDSRVNWAIDTYTKESLIKK